MNRKLRTSAFLMVITIIVITVFQGYWLRKNYVEEKHLFEARTNILFRETVFRLQAAKLKLDSNINIRVQDKAGVVSMTNVLQQKMRDTSVHAGTSHSTMVISLKKGDQPFTKRDSNVTYRRRPASMYGPGPGNRVFDFLIGVDSLRDSITVKEITDRYQNALVKEKIAVPFKILASKSPARNEMEMIPPDPEDNTVVVGFLNPTTYQLQFENTGWYFFKRLSQSVWISVLLVSVTIFSFLLLYRNLVRQRKLTQLKNDFIGNITHELKTPIATVSVAIEAMRNFNALADPKRTQEYLDISANELQRLSLLVDKVLKISMFENKEITLKKEPFDLVQLAEEVMTSMKLQLEKQKATTSMEITGKNFIIEADRLHMTSVIYNLLDNALKYSKEAPHIVVQVIDHTGFIEICVRDNGIGIAKEYKAKIFEQFFRVPSGNRHNIKGYGLGLSYVSHIVQRHMGFIEVESELGMGSSFSVKLPFAEAAVIDYGRGRIVRKIVFPIKKS